MINLLKESDLPKGFKYCPQIKKIIKLDIVNIYPWQLLDEEMSKFFLLEMKKMYPSRDLIPFASYGPNDDYACFEVDKGEEIQIIHFGATAGWEQRGKDMKYNNFWDWFKRAIDDMIEFD